MLSRLIFLFIIFLLFRHAELYAAYATGLRSLRRAFRRCSRLTKIGIYDAISLRVRRGIILMIRIQRIYAYAVALGRARY